MAMGRAKSEIGFRFRAARTAGELSQFAFSSGWARASGQDYLAARFWEDEWRLRGNWITRIVLRFCQREGRIRSAERAEAHLFFS